MTCPRLSLTLAILVLAVALTALARPLPAAEAADLTVAGESLILPAGSGQVFSDSTAAGGQALLIWSNAAAAGTLSTSGAQSIRVRARGDQCSGAPQMVVAVDGKTVLTESVSSSTWATYGADVGLADGSHKLTVAFTNDYSATGCDRNLRVDSLAVAANGGILAGTKWYIDPSSNAKRQADSWRQSRPADAAAMDKIAAQPQADWFGDWSGAIQSAVSSRVSTIASAGTLPVLVAYNIPIRDCHGYSGGGATSASAYRSWIRSFAAGIGSRRAIVVLEPDAL